MTKLDEIRIVANTCRDAEMVKDIKLLLAYIDAVENHIFGNGEYRATFDKFKAKRRALGLE